MKYIITVCEKYSAYKLIEVEADTLQAANELAIQRVEDIATDLENLEWIDTSAIDYEECTE